MLKRKITRKVSAGGVVIGAGAPIAVQSMTKTPTTDIDATLSQIAALAEAGCDIIRIAVPTRKDTDALKAIVEGSSLPVVADIHFSADRAIEQQHWATERYVESACNRPGLGLRPFV